MGKGGGLVIWIQTSTEATYLPTLQRSRRSMTDIMNPRQNLDDVSRLGLFLFILWLLVMTRRRTRTRYSPRSIWRLKPKPGRRIWWRMRRLPSPYPPRNMRQTPAWPQASSLQPTPQKTMENDASWHTHHDPCKNVYGASSALNKSKNATDRLTKGSSGRPAVEVGEVGQTDITQNNSIAMLFTYGWTQNSLSKWNIFI